MEEKVTKIEIVNDKRSGLATASMVLGIIAIVGSWIPFLNVFSIILAFVGLGVGIPALIVYLKKKKGTIGKIIAGLVLCVLTLIIAFGMNSAASKTVNKAGNELNNSVQEATGGKTEDILKNDIEVTIGKYTTDGNEYYESGSLAVTIKNKTNKQQTYTIKIEALDKDGARIETDTIYANDLGAGQTVKEETFKLGSVDKLKTATSFKVYEVSKY